MIPNDPVDFLFRLKTEKPLAWGKKISSGRYAKFVKDVVAKLLAGESADDLWATILTESGFGPKDAKPGRPEAVQDLNEVRKLYDAGLSVSQIAHRLGVSRPTVYNCYVALGLKTKKQKREATEKERRREAVREALAKALKSKQ
ncbi:MAG: helix-turn-helix domain-containing protein [Gemmataceae bacterium]|nr:helix-turn-helix domain-containing protein [Gemmataceae bacterium]